MANSLYITTTEARCGKSLISLGICNVLLRKTGRVGVFRPIIDRGDVQDHDKNIELLINHFGLKINYEDTFAFLEREAIDLLGQGRMDDIIDGVIQKYKVLESRFDFILIIGSDFEGDESAFEVDLNAQIAKNLGAPVLIVSRGDRREVSDVQNVVRVAYDTFIHTGCEVAGIIVNRADPTKLDALKAMLPGCFDTQNTFISVIPADERLSSPTMREVAEQLDAEVLYGADLLDNLAYHYVIISMTIRNYLLHLKENALLITAGDQDSIVLSAIQAHQSRNYPRLAGIILSGDLRPPETVARLIDGLTDIIPVLSVKTPTYPTVQKIMALRSYIMADNPKKIALSLKLFEEHIDTSVLEIILGRVQPRGMTPKMFIYNLIQKAQANKQRIVLPEATDERILIAADQLLAREVVDIIFLGDPKQVQDTIRRLGLKNINPDIHPIINPQTSNRLDEYAQTFHEIRKHKGITIEIARDLMVDVSYFGTMMVLKGHADGMVSGAAHTTAHTISPSLQFVKTKPGFSVVSSVFFMALDDRVLVYGDCAVNPNPTAEQLAEIAIASADTAQTFGISPRVAMLSYSTGDSGSGEEVEKVRKATEIAQARRPELLLEGPMQYDAAVSPDVAAKKMPGSKVAGQATVFIFPDLNTGNNTYKAVQRETGAIAIGPVLQGLNKPVNDLSRGCTVEDIINTVAITAVQAQKN
ncbi:MAG: phosphate acetyltransferase [Candidatus Omnitrophica bacterium]|nr:phosphate acetyltransferase [Candidatus Omnitrophota bacterium]